MRGAFHVVVAAVSGVASFVVMVGNRVPADGAAIVAIVAASMAFVACECIEARWPSRRWWW